MSASTASNGANAKVGFLDRYDPDRLSNPAVFLISMAIFLGLVGFLAAILFRQITSAFMTNPGLNGLIFGVLIVGTILVFLQVIRLFREVKWVNSFKSGDTFGAERTNPQLLAPMRAMLMRQQKGSLSTGSMRSILESIATRLDESRDISRYLTGLLVFLGLLGTFWGLLQTIGSIGSTIQGLDAGAGTTTDILDSLKIGLSEPLEGMGTAFSSSLFGLSGSLVLGFLDLQAGRAQNRFYTELENWLSSVTEIDGDFGSGPVAASGDVSQVMQQLQALQSGASGDAKVQAALANLAEGIQGLVKSMRSEQLIIREWVDAQSDERKQITETLGKISSSLEKMDKRG
ncbi:MAG: flagellar motor protein MotA [Pseudomonadota bacterium]